MDATNSNFWIGDATGIGAPARRDAETLWWEEDEIIDTFLRNACGPVNHASCISADVVEHPTVPAVGLPSTDIAPSVRVPAMWERTYHLDVRTHPTATRWSGL